VSQQADAEDGIANCQLPIANSSLEALAFVNANYAPAHTNPKRKRGPGNDIASLALRVSV
jgi:hypothetical protein